MPAQIAGMSEIVNLRRVKKQRARDAAALAADASRAKHGRTKAEKRSQTLDLERARRQVDQAKLER